MPVVATLVEEKERKQKEQRGRLSCKSSSRTDSVGPTGSSEAGMALQSCSQLAEMIVPAPLFPLLLLEMGCSRKEADLGVR